MYILAIFVGILVAFWIITVLIRKGVKLFMILFIIALVLLGYFGLDFISQSGMTHLVNLFFFWQ
jgi:hypothetical protein